jgi:PmbA protein
VSDLPIVSGTSLYAGRLGETVASSALSLSSRPRDLIGGYFLTGDGYVAENVSLLERGVLKSYLLSLYGARKTGLARARTAGGCFVVESGVRSLAEMLADVDRGLLVTRFSGGAPNDKGDFSGIAKNSYYIEGGTVRYPVAETMISGNMARLLENVVEVSRERADFGDAIFPWCRVRDIGVS